MSLTRCARVSDNVLWARDWEGEMGKTLRYTAIATFKFVIWLLISLVLTACQSAAWASDSELGLPLDQPDSEVPLRVLYIGNLCAGCADAQFEQIAAGMTPTRVIEVDSVVIPRY
jgi:hypothetical protein